MDSQAITTKGDLEHMLLDENMEAKPLSLLLLKCITNELSHEIGRGGFAVVYKGVLEHREVAVKQLSQNHIDEKGFTREVECLMKAKHKNIARFLGYCSETHEQMVKYNGQCVMAGVHQRLLCFEYVPNGTLDEYIKDASREWGECYKIIKGICEGLHYLHEQQIVHRDLKPTNILLDNDMVPKITEFGISRCFDELQTHDFTSKVLGTLGYLAPELVYHGKITLKSDIHSLGTIITEILTGGDKARPKVEKVQEHWNHKLEGSHKELQLEQIRVCTEVAQSCMQYDLEERPSAQEIIYTLKQTERIEEQCTEPGASSHDPRRLEKMLLNMMENMEAKHLPFSLLKCITDNFSHEIGRGNFAVVYKGLLEYREVAVKKLTQDCIDEEKFIAEIRCLMKAKHKNIARFLGYCSDTQGEMVEHNGKFAMADVRQRLLCFEYVPNGSLDKYIKDASREWEKCYKIIKGVCEGLHYLHKKRIVHRDLKPAKILLDNDMVPKITDFGISRSYGELQAHDFNSKLVGTLGCRAPESFDGKISLKTNIYSLGIIIIEILTGDKFCTEVEEVQEHWSHKLNRLQKEPQLKQIQLCTEVAQSCLEFYPEKRPDAQTIIDTLEHYERVEKQGTEPGAGRRRVEVHPRATDKMLMICRQGINKLYDTDMKRIYNSILMEELFRTGYNLVLHQKGGELYSAVETTMVSQVHSLCRHLDDTAAALPDRDSALFLQELVTRWDRHNSAVQLIHDLLIYMDRTFVRTNGKTPVKELGLRLWRHEMARSGKIRQSLIEAVKRQKGGEDELVPGVNKMLTELGAHVKDMPCLCFQDSRGLHVAGP